MEGAIGYEWNGRSSHDYSISASPNGEIEIMAVLSTKALQMRTVGSSTSVLMKNGWLRVRGHPPKEVRYVCAPITKTSYAEGMSIYASA